jgi:hypothetical protein
MLMDTVFGAAEETEKTLMGSGLNDMAGTDELRSRKVWHMCRVECDVAFLVALREEYCTCLVDSGGEKSPRQWDDGFRRSIVSVGRVGLR